MNSLGIFRPVYIARYTIENFTTLKLYQLIQSLILKQKSWVPQKHYYLTISLKRSLLNVFRRKCELSDDRISNQSPFYVIIQLMRPQNNNESPSPHRFNHYQPYSNLQSSPNRFSFSLELITPSIPGKVQLTTKNAQFVDNLIFTKCEKVPHQNTKLGNLKESLNDLQNKISKAKRQLSAFPNILESQLTLKCRDQKTQNDLKISITGENLSTIQSSLDRHSNPSSQLTLLLFPSMKTYYLSHIQGVLEGKNNRALSHLHLSLKILQNQPKIKSPTYSFIEKHKVFFPRDKNYPDKKTLLIDIDETLIRCQEKNDKPYDIAVPVRTQDGGKAFAYITIRPYAISFLKKMSKNFQIIAFTASHEDYADAVLDQLDPERQFITYRLYRKNCFEIFQNIYAKDLRIVNRDLSKLVLLDNSAFSYIIPILPYCGGQDNEFLQLEKYMQQVLKCDDVRQLNKKTFKLHQYCLFSEVEQMVRTLYLNYY